ncbi:hypothetical protein SO802_014169 [Lithocarpus litseifolius]|uniref:Transmembrane protein n=1 Tax=Lithocarpus litseifolius TaxID=425828 RepID=A0AAW2CS81_9ROSI
MSNLLAKLEVVEFMILCVMLFETKSDDELGNDGWCGFHGNIGFGFGVVDVVGIGIEFEDSSGNQRSGSEKRGSLGG